MISKAVLDEMNEQIKLELFSGYLYLSMAAYFESKTLSGFAHWMEKQAGEEQEHALKFYKYINDTGGRVVLQALDQPKTEWESPLVVFEEALAHEKTVTARINHIYSVAVKENDYASQHFLAWYLDEQIEEEKNASEIVEMLKLANNNQTGLMMLNTTLGEREE